MRSIFDLKRNKSDLDSGNQGLADQKYQQVQSIRNIADDNTTVNFSRGEIIFRFTPANGTWTSLARSYFIIDCELTAPDGVTTLVKADNIAPNMGLASNLFSRMGYYIADKDVSVLSKNCAQVDALKTRMGREGHWMNTYGDNFNLWNSSFDKRQNKVITDGVDLDDSKTKEVPYTDFLTALDGANDTLAWTRTGQFFTFGDAALADLLINNNIAVGDHIIATVNGTRRISVITRIDVQDAAGGNLDIYVDEDYGLDVVASNANLAGFFMTAIREKYEPDRRVKRFQLIWRPPLSIFDIEEALPGGMKHEIRLTPYPDTVYQKNAIESILADKTHGAGNDFRFKVTNMYFQAWQCQGPLLDEDEFFLDLNEVNCQLLKKAQNELSQLNVDVEKSTNAIAIAFQDGEAATNTLYSASKFKIRDDEELNLLQLYVDYAGIQKPQPRFDVSYNLVDNTDLQLELMGRSQLNSAGYYDSSGETLKEWRERGIYMYWQWPKTGSDFSTRAKVAAGFSNITANSNILFFNFYKKIVLFKYMNGQLVEIRSDHV